VQKGADSVDFHLLNIKTGEIEKEVTLTIDDERLKEVGMNIKDKGKDEKAK
jgi:hypothetical protein